MMLATVFLIVWLLVYFVKDQMITHWAWLIGAYVIEILFYIVLLILVSRWR